MSSDIPDGDIPDIERLRRFAEAVVAGLPTVRAGRPAGARRCDRVQALARDLHARAGQRISVAAVGEYSAGKSLLVSLLIGLPALLPASSTPTTANVTALRLRPAPPGDPARLRSISVSFLSTATVGEMVDHLVGAVASLVNDNRLPYPAGMLADYHPVAQGWGRFDDFARSVWKDQSANVDLKLRLAELVRIRDALLVGRQLLPATGPGPLRAIGDDVLSSAVEIGNSRKIPEDFPEQTAALPIAPDSELDAGVLARAQPLIHRVTYDLEVPVAEWGLGELLAAPGVEILDMPGLNAAGGGRDEYLALRELRHVTALLVVLDLVKPEAAAVLKLSTFLEAARASREQLVNSRLVVGNKFDVLPCLAGDVRSWSAEFESLNRMTDQLTGRRPELVSYTSAHAGLAARDLPVPPGSISPDELARNRRHWREVAGARSGQPVAGPLRDYADDGGIDGLRRRLAGHVLRHGVTVHVTEMRAVAEDIRSELAALERWGAPRPPAGLGASVGNRMAAFCSELNAAVRTVRGELAQLWNVGALPLPDGCGSLLDAVRQQVVADVYRWDQWTQLTGSVSRGTVPIVAATAELDHDELFPDDLFPENLSPELDHRTLIPVTTSEFRDPFEETLRAADVKLEHMLRDCVRCWVTTTASSLDTVRDQLRDPELLGFIADSTPGGSARGNIRRQRLRELDGLGFVDTELDRSLARVPRLDPERAFPLSVERALAWHPKAPRPEDPAAEQLRRHHSVVLRMRCSVAESIGQHAQRRLAMILLELVTRLGRDITMIAREIPGRAELRAMQRAEAPATAEPPDPGGDAIRDLLDGRWGARDENGQEEGLDA